MDYSNKKLLILGGAYLHNKVVECAREMGIYTIVTDNVPNAPAKLAADKYYDLNVSDVDGIVEMCRAEKVDAVLTVCLDFCQLYYQQICQRLGLPCYGTAEQFDILTNKKRFRAVCEEYGVDVIPAYTQEDIELNRAHVEYPVLVKPALSRGSKGQCVCNTRSEALAAIKFAAEISENGCVVIEKCMHGKEDFQVTYLICNGHVYVVRTADRYLGSVEEGMDRVAIALSSPSSNTGLYFDKVHNKVATMLKAMGIYNAPVFMQGFVDGDTIRFYDPGLRFPGGDYDRIFASEIGVNLMQMLIEMAFTGHAENAEQKLNDRIAYLNGGIIFTLHSTIRAGTIQSVTPASELLKIDGVHYVSFRHKAGETVPFTGTVNQRIAEINIFAPSAQRLNYTVEAVKDTLVVLDDTESDMIFSKFDMKNWRPAK